MGLVLKQCAWPWQSLLQTTTTQQKKHHCTRWLYPLTEVAKDTKWQPCQKQRGNEAEMKRKERAREKRAAV